MMDPAGAKRQKISDDEIKSMTQKEFEVYFREILKRAVDARCMPILDRLEVEQVARQMVEEEFAKESSSLVEPVERLLLRVCEFALEKCQKIVEVEKIVVEKIVEKIVEVEKIVYVEKIVEVEKIVYIEESVPLAATALPPCTQFDEDSLSLNEETQRLPFTQFDTEDQPP